MTSSRYTFVVSVVLLLTSLFQGSDHRVSVYICVNIAFHEHKRIIVHVFSFSYRYLKAFSMSERISNELNKARTYKAATSHQR